MKYKEAIQKRKSTREYHDQEIERDRLNQIKNQIEGTETLFGNKISSKIVKKEEIINSLGGIIGDYGKVKSPYYLLLAPKEENKQELIDTGFYGEKIVIELTKESLGTCWIGKIGKREEIAKEVGLRHPPTALIAFGEAKNNPHRQSKPKRKQTKNLLLKGELTEEDKELLELIKLAPSAINQQPWRFVITENQIDFYLTSKGIFKKLLKKISNLKRLNYIDMGIAIRHAELILKEKQKKPVFTENKKEPYKKHEYIISLKK